jgi:hypothetical protein
VQLPRDRVALLEQQQARREAEREVQRKLAVGDSEVVDVLDGVSPALPLPAQRAVQSASGAIEQEDRREAAVSIAATSGANRGP